MKRSAAMMIAALACALAPPALAQSGTPYEQAAIALAGKCLGAVPATDPAAAIEACEATLVDIVGVRAGFEPLIGHDQNVDLVVRTMAISRLGRAYSVLDGGVRSARVCTEVENGWALVSQMNPAASPQYATTMETLRASQIEVLTKCRNERGTPPGAVPLPG